MAQISHYFANLEKMQERDTWDDKEIMRTIILLREEFHETSRMHSVDYDDTVINWLGQSERRVNRFGTALKKGTRNRSFQS